MWNHDVRTHEIRMARLSGFHRQLCLRSTVYWGAPEKPRVVLGLDHGRIFDGRVFHIFGEDLDPDLFLLWDQEMLADSPIGSD